VEHAFDVALVGSLRETVEGLLVIGLHPWATLEDKLTLLDSGLYAAIARSLLVVTVRLDKVNRHIQTMGVPITQLQLSVDVLQLSCFPINDRA
jgi:hypothetical protein